MKRLAPLFLAAAAPLTLMGIVGVMTSTEVRAEDPVVNDDARLAVFFENYDKQVLDYSPQGKTYRGIRDGDYGKWDDPSDAAAVARHNRDQIALTEMKRAFAGAALSDKSRLSMRLFEDMIARRDALFPYRNNGYIFDQMNGAQSDLPAFLINSHSITNEEQAHAYIRRLRGLGPLLDKLNAQSAARAANGVMPPKWVYPKVISDARNMMVAGEAHPLDSDFAKKVDALKLDPTKTAALKAEASAAIAVSVVPAYGRLITEMERQEKIAPTDDGIWRLSDGAPYYNALLSNYTTTNLTADEIHNIGLREVARIHGEMEAIKAKVGFKGSLKEFFTHLRTDDQFYYPTREAYLADADAKLAAMTVALPKFFHTLPKAPLVVKPVEAFREQSAGKAFYGRPAPDGSRPGIYYVNLYDLKSMSKNELEALAYHEGLPGHHLQLAIQTELKNVPPFRQFGSVTAYSEGWGLYSEELGKNMGFYTDPYSDFGRLGMELWRACRLVVDTGIHSKKWSREQAIQYLVENTPNPQGDIDRAIERYVVYPGQATAYMIGKLKIMELRDRAQSKLGAKFDIRDFHDVVLKSGPVSLAVLEDNVDHWLKQAQK